MSKVIYDFPARLPVDNSFITARETEVLWLCIKCMTVSQTADALGISPRTVSKHRDNIRRKFNLIGYHELEKFGVKHRTLLKKYAK